MRIVIFFLVIVSVHSLGLSQQAGALSEVKKIFVDSFGAAEGAELIKEKLINRLVKSGRVTVVDNRVAADAVLSGIGEVNKGVRYSSNSGQYGGAASGGTSYDATLVVRLLGKDKQILWVDEAKPGFMPGSVSSSVADKVSKNLLKAIEKASNQK